MGKPLNPDVEYCFDVITTIKWNIPIGYGRYANRVKINLEMQDKNRNKILQRKIAGVVLGEFDKMLSIPERFDLLKEKRDVIINAVIRAKKDFADYNYDNNVKSKNKRGR